MYKVKGSLTPEPIRQIFYKQDKHCNVRCGEFPFPNFRKVKYGKHNVPYLDAYLWGKINQSIIIRRKNCLYYSLGLRNLGS